MFKAGEREGRNSDQVESSVEEYVLAGRHVNIVFGTRNFSPLPAFYFRPRLIIRRVYIYIEMPLIDDFRISTILRFRIISYRLVLTHNC